MGGLAGCARGSQDGAESEPTPEGGLFEATSDPSLMQTLQAEAAATAAFIARLTPAAATPQPSPTMEIGTVEGTPPADRSGPCPVPDGYVVHDRAGFCLSAPEGWEVLNVDGGLAASLDTTPGQAIALRPSWAGSTAVCSLMVYVAAGRSAVDHLQEHYEDFAARADLAALTPLRMQNLAGMAILGFEWAADGGEAGGLFAENVAVNRMARVSYSGTQCPVEDLLPVLETLRFNIED
jgi:hypothetical protein